MSDTFEPEKIQDAVSSSLSNASRDLYQAGNKLSGDVRKFAGDNVPYLLIGSVVVAALVGILLVQREERKMRDKWAENLRRDAIAWLHKHGRKVAEPIREQIEHVADRAASYGLSLTPKRRKFFDLF
jgi:hypothetical protein